MLQSELLALPEHAQLCINRIKNILQFELWEDCRIEVKSIYQSIRHTLSEEEQEALLLELYLDTLVEDDYSTYWNYMNRY